MADEQQVQYLFEFCQREMTDKSSGWVPINTRLHAAADIEALQMRLENAGFRIRRQRDGLTLTRV